MSPARFHCILSLSLSPRELRNNPIFFSFPLSRRHHSFCYSQCYLSRGNHVTRRPEPACTVPSSYSLITQSIRLILVLCECSGSGYRQEVHEFPRDFEFPNSWKFALGRTPRSHGIFLRHKFDSPSTRLILTWVKFLTRLATNGKII